MTLLLTNKEPGPIDIVDKVKQVRPYVEQRECITQKQDPEHPVQSASPQWCIKRDLFESNRKSSVEGQRLSYSEKSKIKLFIPPWSATARPPNPAEHVGVINHGRQVLEDDGKFSRAQIFIDYFYPKKLRHFPREFST